MRQGSGESIATAVALAVTAAIGWGTSPAVGGGDGRATTRAAQPARTGRIEGTVIISPALVARRPRFRIYAGDGPGSQPPPAARPDLSEELRNVVIYIDGDVVAGSGSRTPAVAQMSQRDERFVPHVLPIVRGDSVRFPNEDDFFHNVFSLSSTGKFDLGRYPRGAVRTQPFAKPGTARVFCHIHSDMSGVILVLGNRHFAVPAVNGRFVLDGVPPGEYTVVGWHERIKAVPQRVRVVEGQTARLDFNLPLPPPGPQ
jgi:plastocyanin